MGNDYCVITNAHTKKLSILIAINWTGDCQKLLPVEMPRKVIKITSLTSRGAFQNMFTIAMNLLKKLPFKCSVSSVQGKDVKQYGKQHMFDSVAETSWNSSEGTPQWVIIRFEEPQAVSKFSFQFQGGFAAKTLSIHAETEDGKQILEEAFYPEDINSTQSFILNHPIESKEAVKIKFLFPSSTDFFGRIILYELEIFE